ncbi:THUMP domain-containing protein [Picrophilus oshimae]|uniref:tRNA sulfurtransferase n=1 Tax=Picrophilus torridus (strain ATCC 700027 / DSM 9790 / JCM 10055 / NBRC 100828 / KAW 2/3) TaxID=1122961 RepID=A0A8G2L765_PICTO|nr:THUMP domain-containing protein [Picrophilus oshimae]SMD30625.1 thiamine biosynthesis protein ThiI [Picrophilus oshimae DSM 9789]
MYIVRYSEIGIKGERARRKMEGILSYNIKAALESLNINADVIRTRGRIYVMSDNDISDLLKRIFGIKSFSSALMFKFSSIDDIKNIVYRLYNEKVYKKTFGIFAKRAGNHKFTSKDVERIVGDALYKNSNGVDLENPEVPIYIEIRDDKFYVFDRIIPGTGGLPLRSEGSALSLFSGGNDSPLATYMVMKRGSPCDLLFCSFAHPEDTYNMLLSARRLFDKYSYGYDPLIYIIDGTELASRIMERNQKYGNLIFKKLLYLYADNLCSLKNYNAMVTGESIGQVSSQTLENLRSLSHGIDHPILRPLIGFDKDEIVSKSRELEIFEYNHLGEFCSIVSKRPGVRVSVDELNNEMRYYNIDLMKTSLVLKYSEINNYINAMKLSFIRDIPDDAVVMDLRPASDYIKWHLNGSLNIDVKNLKNMNFDKDKTYVFYCRKGLNSAYAASILRKNGINAYYTTENNVKRLKPNSL